MLRDQGKLAAAEPIYRQAAVEAERILGAEHRSTLAAVEIHKRVLGEMGQRRQRRKRTMLVASLTPSPPFVFRPRISIPTASFSPSRRGHRLILLILMATIPKDPQTKNFPCHGLLPLKSQAPSRSSPLGRFYLRPKDQVVTDRGFGRSASRDG